MGKALYLLVILALLGSVRCYQADLAASLSGLPIVGPMIEPPAATPAYVGTIGTAAALELPETDFKTWFPTDPAVDPYAPATWSAIRDFLAYTRNEAGWTEACKKVSAAAGADRTASPALGALACSADPSVTALQPFATGILAARAEVALWIKGAPGSSVSAIQARQGELRVLCTPENLRRLDGPDGPFGQACTKAFDGSYLAAEAKATFTALGEAYALVAAELAKRDPKIAAEPTFFGAAAKK